MEKTMGSALSALKAQVEAGFAPKCGSEAYENSHAPAERQVLIGSVFSEAENARDELRHTGYGR